MSNAEDSEDDSLWAPDSFIQSISPAEMKQKEKTIHMKHDEDVNYPCRKCKAKMSAHNRDWHDGMCDPCFDATYFPDARGRKATAHYPAAHRNVTNREVPKTPLVKVLEGMRDAEQRKKPKKRSVGLRKEKSLWYYSGWKR